ncbi:MAG: hypothetical protein WCW17_00055 [Patescibacteria group bacterium]|jgi:hypothetical protein
MKKQIILTCLIIITLCVFSGLKVAFADNVTQYQSQTINFGSSGQPNYPYQQSSLNGMPTDNQQIQSPNYNNTNPTGYQNMDPRMGAGNQDHQESRRREPSLFQSIVSKLIPVAIAKYLIGIPFTGGLHF